LPENEEIPGREDDAMKEAAEVLWNDPIFSVELRNLLF
jgi:hypothetical protein